MTVSIIVVGCDTVPLEPFTVIVKLPLGVELDVATVTVDEPEPVIDVGFNVGVAPEGNPLTARLTTPLKPFNELTVIW